MNNLPLVSILVPVYNVEQYIERCARSLFEQTYDKLEYIFVDDCTPDNSIQILKEVLSKYPHRLSQVKIIKHIQNEGVAVGRNTAMENATGDFAFFVDSDDYIEVDAIATLVDFQRQTNADIVTGKRYVNDSDIVLSYVEPIYNDKDEMLMTILSNVWHHEITNRLIRRSLFVENDIKALPHVNICEDWQLIAKTVYYAESCVTTDKITYHYVYNPNSLVHSNTDWEKEKKAYAQEYKSMLNIMEFYEGTRYEGVISSLFIRRQSDLIDLGIKHHDKEFFDSCRSNILSIKIPPLNTISTRKLKCIKLGYFATCFFLFLHQIKQRFKRV